MNPPRGHSMPYAKTQSVFCLSQAVDAADVRVVVGGAAAVVAAVAVVAVAQDVVVVVVVVGVGVGGVAVIAVAVAVAAKAIVITMLGRDARHEMLGLHSIGMSLAEAHWLSCAEPWQVCSLHQRCSSTRINSVVALSHMCTLPVAPSPDVGAETLVLTSDPPQCVCRAF